MGGTREEQATAVAGDLSYAGTFEVDEANGLVIPHIKSALTSYWFGRDF